MGGRHNIGMGKITQKVFKCIWGSMGLGACLVWASRRDVALEKGQWMHWGTHSARRAVSSILQCVRAVWRRNSCRWRRWEPLERAPVAGREEALLAAAELVSRAAVTRAISRCGRRPLTCVEGALIIAQTTNTKGVALLHYLSFSQTVTRNAMA